MSKNNGNNGNDVSLFKLGAHDVRATMREGNPWFHAMDVCKALTFANLQRGVAQYLGRLGSEERRIITLERIKGNPNVTFISESGLYKLVMRSDKKEAEEFQNWVTRVVLPAIRKDGGYIHGEEHVASGAMTEDELVFKAMEVMKRKIENS